MYCKFVSIVASVLTGRSAMAQTAPSGDIPPDFKPPHEARDYVKREEMIPMRDGTKLFTVIVFAKGISNAPIVLTRTPYDAAGRAKRLISPHMLSTLPLADEPFVKAGYIRVYQDVRGKYGSEGDYVLTRPVIGPLNSTKVDHVTDAYDTIDWLVNKANLPESNGRVGMIGSSYEGFTVVMALLDPHPALKVAAPESPMIDGWMGDDWFHYGAFRLANIGWIGSQTGYKGAGKEPGTGIYDHYEEFRRIGGADEWAKKSGFDQLPAWQRMVAHPAYDEYWQGQALDKLIAANPSNVPTLWEQGLWDQEDMYGAITAWEALKAKGKIGNNFLVMGPWRHSQINREGRALRPDAVGRRYGGSISRADGAAAVQSIFERWPAGQTPGGGDLQHGRGSVGTVCRLAVGLRAGLRSAAQADLYEGRWRPGIRQRRSGGGQLCFRSGQACATPAAPRELRRWPLGRLAVERSASCVTVVPM